MFDVQAPPCMYNISTKNGIEKKEKKKQVA